MGLTDEALKGQLKAKLEELLESLMAEKSDPATIHLSEIEQLVQQTGEKFKAALTAGLAAQASEADRAGEGPVCPGCGRAMHAKGQKTKYVETETGPVRLKRTYYYCIACRKGVFPPG